MMKQFGRTMLTVLGLVVAAVVLSSVPAQAAGPSVVAHALVPFAFLEDTSNSADPVFAFVTVITGNGGQALFYNINDQNNTFFYFGNGFIPASSVNVSGGAVNTGKTVVTVNVNTCDVAGFMTSSGPCGAFDITFTEVPASVDGSFATRGDEVQTLASGGRIETNGEMVSFGATATGTALGESFGAGFGSLVQQTNVTVTITQP